MEKDDEVSGQGNQYDFGARIYNPRLGRWLSTDPLQSDYPSMSPYNYVANSPIVYIDPDGERIYVHGTKKYVRKVVRYLAIIYSTEKGSEMINSLTESGKTYNIRSTTFPWEGTIYSEQNDRTLTFRANEPVKISKDIDTGDKGSLFDLGHELKHALDDEENVNLGGSIRASEFRAVQFANYLRDVFGYKNLRSRYKQRGFISWMMSEIDLNIKDETLAKINEEGESVDLNKSTGVDIEFETSKQQIYDVNFSFDKNAEGSNCFEFCTRKEIKALFKSQKVKVQVDPVSK